MSLGTMLSRVLGMVRDILISTLFSRTVTDAFVVAFRLPNMFRRLLGEGSLSVSFIPVFVGELNVPAEELEEVRAQRARELANGIYTILMIVTVSLTVLGIIYMEPLLRLMLRGESYLSIPGKLEQTVYLGRIMFGYLFLVTTYAYYMAIANALNKFLIPAMGPALFNLFCVISSVLPQEWLDQPGAMSAWGVIVGGVFQALIVGVQIWRLGFFPRITMKVHVPGAWIVLRNMVPGILGSGVAQLTTIVNMAFASYLPEGSHSYVYWGDRILELPQSLIAISLGTALLPMLSKHWVEGKKQQMIDASNNYLRFLLYLSLPAAVGMYVLALPLVQVLFVRGQFGIDDALATVNVIQIYSFLLIFSGMSRVLVPSFYAIKNTWLPALLGALSLLVHLGLCQYTIGVFGLNGLVGSTAMSGAFNAIALMICFWLMIGPIHVKALLISFMRNVPALAALAAFAYFGYAWLEPQLETFVGIHWARGGALLSIVGVSIVGYIFMSYKLGSEEAAQFIEVFRRRMKKH